jgi:nicotinate-nucleotide adenylyltransferase
MSQAARIGILGGTLDPIHLGHLDAALAAREALRLDSVIITPAHVPPHRSRPVTSAYHRFAMAALAINGVDGLLVSDMELVAAGPSYTADTLVRLREQSDLHASQLFFITGADAFAEIATWSRYPAVLDLAHFVVVTRPGSTLDTVAERLPALAGRFRRPADLDRSPGTGVVLVEAVTPDVSSTVIRARAAKGFSLAGLVPPRVEQYIRRHGLYMERTSVVGALHGQDE